MNADPSSDSCSRTIALLTDFGLSDCFAGQMKGVIRRIAPRATMIDLTHLVPPQSIMLGAVYLQNCIPFFPAETIFVAIVDPGVGTDRRALIAHAGDHYFVGPDNGLLSFAMNATAQVHEIENPAYLLPEISATFHGRDVFAPAAAHLSLGVPLEEFGRRVGEIIRLQWPKPQPCSDAEWKVPIIGVDNFGNIITGLRAETLRHLNVRDLMFEVNGLHIGIISSTFGSVMAGQWLAYWGSDGLLEIAINSGNAAAECGLGAGDFIQMKDLARAPEARKGGTRA